VGSNPQGRAHAITHGKFVVTSENFPFTRDLRASRGFVIFFLYFLGAKLFSTCRY